MEIWQSDGAGWGKFGVSSSRSIWVCRGRLVITSAFVPVCQIVQADGLLWFSGRIRLKPNFSDPKMWQSPSFLGLQLVEHVGQNQTHRLTMSLIFSSLRSPGATEANDELFLSRFAPFSVGMSWSLIGQTDWLAVQVLKVQIFMIKGEFVRCFLLHWFGVCRFQLSFCDAYQRCKKSHS